MSRVSPPTALRLIGVLALATTTACASLPGQSQKKSVPEGAIPGGHIITAEDILRTGATDAFEALERGGTHLLITHPGADHAVRISHRGADSLLLGNAILLVVDGSRVNHPGDMLRSIPAGSIVFIQVLSGREASVQWGSEAGNGVILVQTAAR